MDSNDQLISQIMDTKEKSIMLPLEYEESPVFSIKEIQNIFEEIVDTENIYFNYIFKKKNLSMSIYQLVNSNINSKITLGEYILLKFIDWGPISYKDNQTKKFIFQIIRYMKTFDVMLFLNDYCDKEYRYFPSILRARYEDIEKIKARSEVISIAMLIKKIDMSDFYKEYKYILAFHPDYLHSDSSNRLFYNDFDEELLKITLKFYGEVELYFDLSEYKSYLAYLSLTKYFILCENNLTSVYFSFISGVYNIQKIDQKN